MPEPADHPRTPWSAILVCLLLSLGFLVVVCFLAGCMDVALWEARTFYGLDCRPEHRVHGECVPVQKGGAHADVARP